MGGVSIIVFIAVAIGLIQASRHDDDEKRRKATPVYFNDGFTPEEFEDAVFRAMKGIPGLKEVSVDGAKVNCTVKALYRIPEWQFSIDFNDYGHITGEYWIDALEGELGIPDRLARSIRTQIAAMKSPAK